MEQQNAKEITRVVGGLRGEIEIPGDKSVSHRSVMLAGLCDTPVRISNYLHAADCLSTAAAMEALGVSVRWSDDTTLTVTGRGFDGLTEPAGILDAGDSGTMLRLMMGLLAPQPFLSTFTGDAALYRRPMGRVIAPLSEMGARIAGRAGGKYLPITILPAEQKLHGIQYKMPMASAQVKSAILLAGLRAEGETMVVEPYPSRDHTERMLRAFGVEIRQDGTRVACRAARKLSAPDRIDVPGDISSAAFWLVAASVIPGSDLLLKGVGVNPTRTGVLDVLRDMGAHIERLHERESGGEPIADIRVRSAKLHGVSFGGAIIPRLIDEIPILAVAALFADGDTKITGAEELRVKETNRLHAVAAEYNKLAPCVEELADGLVIRGGAKIHHAECFSYDDHRMAMSLAVAGAAGDGVTIENPECVDISYPAFYKTMLDLQR
ncbi:MAG: 3-phosphoshikimate 1-carboxyvinyltransferase [Schwartzia sp.]|nr:3-phosphoshikimate 1-carboxyvinyltransferase [Schwartzia sp. (in: firmicutes)]